MLSIPLTFGLRVLILLDWTLIILGPVPDETDDNGSAVLLDTKSSSEFFFIVFRPPVLVEVVLTRLVFCYWVVFLLGKLGLAWKLKLDLGIKAETGSADFLVYSLSAALMRLFFSSFFTYFISTEFYPLPFTVL